MSSGLRRSGERGTSALRRGTGHRPGRACPRSRRWGTRPSLLPLPAYSFVATLNVFRCECDKRPRSPGARPILRRERSAGAEPEAVADATGWAGAPEGPARAHSRGAAPAARPVAGCRDRAFGVSLPGFGAPAIRRRRWTASPGAGLQAAHPRPSSRRQYLQGQHLRCRRRSPLADHRRSRLSLRPRWRPQWRHQNATLKVYAGAPHGLAYTHKDELNADLLAFLRT